MITPQYIFSKEKLKSNYNKMSELLYNSQIFYTLKTNAELSIIYELNKLNSSFECASKNEFQTLLNMNVPLEKIIFGLPIKSEELIIYVYKNGGKYFVFEEMSELGKLCRLAPNSKKILRLYINNIVSSTIDYGMNYEEILEHDKETGFLKEIDGISFHISDNSNVEDMQNVCKIVEKLLERLNSLSSKKYILNIGGGYKIDAGNDYYYHVNRILEKLKLDYNIAIYAELGESIVGSAGRFFSKVVMIKKSSKIVDLYIDGGFPNGFAARKPPTSVRTVDKDIKLSERYIYRFIDCMGYVLFSKRLNLEICEGDILEFENCGAYTTVFQNSFQSYENCLVTNI